MKQTRKSRPSMKSLRRILARMADARIVVAGDLILDCYVSGKVKRINPEAPSPLVDVEEIWYRLGGAANVAGNVVALGAQVKLIGVIGADDKGRLMLSRLEERGIDGSEIIVDPSRPTTLKTRVISRRQQVVRFDQEVTTPLDDKLEKKLAEQSFAEAIVDSSFVILSDYNKGIFRGGFAQKVLRSAERKGVKVAVDPKVANIKRFKKAFMITPNRMEAEEIVGSPLENDKDVERGGKILAKKLTCSNVIITRGAKGMSHICADEPATHVPTWVRYVYDVTGAGDTAIAVLTTAVAAGASIYEAMWIANAAGGVAVSRFGTVAVTVDEIEAQLEDELRRL